MATQENRVKAEIRKKYKEQEALALIEQFLETQSKLGQIKTVSFEKELKEKTAGILEKEKELGIVAIALCRLKNQYLFLNLIVGTKLIYLMRSIVFALNDDHHLLLALCSRLQGPSRVRTQYKPFGGHATLDAFCFYFFWICGRFRIFLASLGVATSLPRYFAI